MSCPHIRLTGEPCGRPVGRFSRCYDHRERAASKPSRPCSSCGKPTKRAGGLCIGRACGWNAYRRELAQRKKAAAAEELAAQDAAEDRDRRAEEAAEEVADALAGLKPWPEWLTMTADEFEARAEAAAAAESRREDAAAALVAALVAAEAEAAAAAERDRAAREQLDRLRRVYAAAGAAALGNAALCGSSAVRSGAALPRASAAC